MVKAGTPIKGKQKQTKKASLPSAEPVTAGLDIGKNGVTGMVISSGCVTLGSSGDPPALPAKKADAEFAELVKSQVESSCAIFRSLATDNTANVHGPRLYGPPAELPQVMPAAMHDAVVVAAESDVQAEPGSVTVTLPLGPMPPEHVYISNAIHVKGLSQKQRFAWKQLETGLYASGATLLNGTPVNDGGKAIRWVLEAIAK